MFKNSGSFIQFQVLVMARQKNWMAESIITSSSSEFLWRETGGQDNWKAYQVAPEMPTSFLRSMHCSKPKTDKVKWTGWTCSQWRYYEYLREGWRKTPIPPQVISLQPTVSSIRSLNRSSTLVEEQYQEWLN